MFLVNVSTDKEISVVLTTNNYITAEMYYNGYNLSAHENSIYITDNYSGRSIELIRRNNTKQGDK